MWSQTRATQEATALKAKKGEKKEFKTNSKIKKIKLEAGEDDATMIFHPQRYSLRPPVSGITKVWPSYPTHWPEVYYSVDLSDVGLDNVFGQKQLELLHDRRSKIEVKMFASANAHIGRGGFKTMTLKTQEDGSTDIQNKDDWLSLASVNELEMALDNLVTAWACFWEGDRSMVTLRRVVTKNKSFASISNTSTRLRLLETFINKVLEINQRKAIQSDVPMTFLEVDKMALDYKQNVSEYVREPASSPAIQEQQQRGSGGGRGGKGGQGGRNQDSRGVNKDSGEEQTRRILEGHTVRGKKFCIDFQQKDNNGDPKCRDKKCSKAHMCGFVDKFTRKPCGMSHAKFEHHART